MTNKITNEEYTKAVNRLTEDTSIFDTFKVEDDLIPGVGLSTHISLKGYGMEVTIYKDRVLFETDEDGSNLTPEELNAINILQKWLRENK